MQKKNGDGQHCMFVLIWKWDSHWIKASEMFLIWFPIGWTASIHFILFRFVFNLHFGRLEWWSFASETFDYSHFGNCYGIFYRNWGPCYIDSGQISNVNCVINMARQHAHTRVAGELNKNKLLKCVLHCSVVCQTKSSLNLISHWCVRFASNCFKWHWSFSVFSTNQM